MHDFEMGPRTTKTVVRPDTSYCDTDEVLDEEPPARAREGLPPAYRMRHASHYVEQLMGDTPLQSVRQIDIDQLIQVEAPGAVPGDTSQLIASIRQFGVLQPLLVAPRDGGKFVLLSGDLRFWAARETGLKAVPCLVIQADDETATALRAQAAIRSVSTTESPVEIPPAVPSVAGGEEVLSAAFAEIADSLDFIRKLAPSSTGAGAVFRHAMIADVMQVETRRASTLASAAALLMRTEPLRSAPVDCADVLEELRPHVSLEARLKDVVVEWSQSLELGATTAERDALLQSWAGMLHAALGIAQSGDRVSVALTSTRVRPAVILTITISRTAAEGRSLSAAGKLPEVMLAGALQGARLHRGRLSVVSSDGGIKMEFVAPQVVS